MGGEHFEKKKRRKLAVLIVTESREYASSKERFYCFWHEKSNQFETFLEFVVSNTLPLSNSSSKLFSILTVNSVFLLGIILNTGICYFLQS